MQLLDKDTQIEQLKARIKEFEEDRFCSGGCALYQFDKLDMFKTMFIDIKEAAVMIKSAMIILPLFKESYMITLLNKIIETCNIALDGSKW